MNPVNNSGSGAGVGKDVHTPFVITKELDKSSPLLYQSLLNNENMAEWELQFGNLQLPVLKKQDYTVKLTNATIVDIRFVMPNNKYADLAKLNNYEEVEFIYQQVQWTWVNGAISADADW